MQFNPGTEVITPTGRKAIVRSNDTLKTGKRGRPAHVVVVQERDGGRFIEGLVRYHAKEVVPAY